MNREQAFLMSGFLSQNSSVKQIMLYGSVAQNHLNTDMFSDCDMVIITDDDMEFFSNHLDWISEFKTVFGYEKYCEEHHITIRVCFDDFTRYDLVFYKESSFKEKGKDILFKNEYEVLYSRMSCRRLTGKTFEKEKSIMESESVHRFWFMVVIAFCKLMRGDYLIGSHLILELMQELIVLQMKERDTKKGTSSHRYGEKEAITVFKEIESIGLVSNKESLIRVLKKTCSVYETEMIKLEKDYRARLEILDDWIERHANMNGG
jgi:predicted nucleotidyltransferase